MRSSCQKIGQLALVLMLLSGCAGTEVKNTDSLKTDSTRTELEGAAAGTVVGAGIGAVIGHVIGGKEGAKLGAALGGVLGLGAGAIVGNSFVERKQSYVDTEDRLNNNIKVATATNTQLREYNTQTETRIAILSKEISQLEFDRKKRSFYYSQLRQKQDEIRIMISSSEQQRHAKMKELDTLCEYLASTDRTENHPQLTQLNREIDELKSNIAVLDSNNKQMALMADSLTVRK